MHIRHIPLYALAAGALAVSVLLFGDGDGADAATEATGKVTDAVTGAAPAVDGSHAVVVEPDPVAPGGAFSVHDGGSCAGDSAEATFEGADIPAVQLSSGSERLGGSAIVPEGTAPGSYRVTVVCGGTSGARQSALETDRSGTGEHGEADGTEHGDTDGGERGKDHGGRKTLTGTMVVSGDGDETEGVVPQGGADTGLGGAAGSGRAATALGGVVLLAAAGGGALVRRRRARGDRS
ncbi:hypothetical protein [Streptomyces sp. NPDC058773]|uniref:hypothetical protein n=1 Tax=Streptomyces sp. NPDC058773 TaxID=3346632 RepID=UPI003699FBFA